MMTNVLNIDVPLDEANEYFGLRLNTTVWDNANDEMRKQALSQAGMLISSAFVFSKEAYEIDSATGSVIWNKRIISSVCEEALWLLTRDPSEIPDALFNGVSSASAGNVSATFDKSFVIPWICPVARTIVGSLGTFIAGDDDSYVHSTPMSL